MNQQDQKRSTEIDLTKLLPTIERDSIHYADCPMCLERMALQIYAENIWRCVSCNRKGDAETLKEYMGEPFALMVDKANQDKVPEGLIVVGRYHEPKQQKAIATGMNPLDRMLGGLARGMLSVMTGKRGEGKSTMAAQLALNMVNEGERVCFYSGELMASTFQSWIVSQAAGPRYLDSYTDRFGETRYRVDDHAKGKILSWFGDNLILYDNTVIKASERNSILERFTVANTVYGCNVFFVDNLMTADIPIDQERDFYRAQSNFVRDLAAFALQHDAHVILVAHPRKNIGNDWNDAVAGTGDVTNLASNVFVVSRVKDKEWGAELEVVKNRQHGVLGAIRFNFDIPSRRFVLAFGEQTDKYWWEEDM